MSKFEVKKDLPDIPERVKAWAEKELFENHGFIYYKRSGRKVTCLCGACGGTYEGVEKASPDIDGWAEHIIYARNKMKAKCELCGNESEYKPIGMHKRVYNSWHDYDYIQKIDDYIVYRTVSVMASLIPGKKTKYEHREYSRLYMKLGAGMRKFEYRWHWGAASTWDEVENFTPDKDGGWLYPPSIKVAEKYFKYIPKPKETRKGPYHKAYYGAAAKYKDYEMALKLGLSDIASKMAFEKGHGLNLNTRAKHIEDRLRIHKDRLKPLISLKGDIEYLKAYQIERKSGKHFTDEDITAIVGISKIIYGKEKGAYAELLKYYSPAKIWDYTEQMIKKYGNTKGRYISRSFYFDYISMRIEMGYDLGNSIYAFPKDILRKHDELVNMRNEKERKEREDKKNKQFPNISKNYKKLCRKYQAMAAGLMIRPAKNASEIIEEGATLHHCVGASDTYMSRHNKGETYILFIRRAKEPDEPYITVEMSKDGEIKQWYGTHDSKPNKATIDKWLKEYTKALKDNKAKHKEAV